MYENFVLCIIEYCFVYENFVSCIVNIVLCMRIVLCIVNIVLCMRIVLCIVNFVLCIALVGHRKKQIIESIFQRIIIRYIVGCHKTNHRQMGHCITNNTFAQKLKQFLARKFY